MTWSAIQLPWLPQAPGNFRKLCENLESAPAVEGSKLQQLAAHSLDLTQLTRLAKTFARLRDAGKITNLTPFTLGIVGNGTTSLLVAPLVASALRHGIALSVIEAPFDQAAQWTLDLSSPLHTGNPDAVLFAFDHRIIPVPRDPTSVEEATSALSVATSFMDSLRAGLRQGCGAPAIVQTLATPPDVLLGSYDQFLPGSRRALVAQFNGDLLASLKSGADVLFDVAGLAYTVGVENWYDAPQWYMAKLSPAQSAVPLYAEHAARLIAAMRGKSRKCLVFDLDNTLWGGVIGDDGLDGISIGQGDATGEAYLDIQLTALMLRRLGVILAVSSKNDDAIARTPFKDHPDMALREADIAVFQANWQDKATNLEAIAKALDIGIDSLVLVDDNPVERAQVRAALPMVAVPELPTDPAFFRSALLAAGYFEAITFSDEDRIRADQYSANAMRQELAGRSRDLGEFLRSLAMVISFSPFNESGRARIAQLINKSNQFNLTTRRYTETRIAEIEFDQATFALQIRMADSFGDNGMISVVICRQHSSAWEIDTWVMSCRVLGRRVEEAILSEIIANARVVGISKLTGRYLPTPRNALVRDHYEKLGFELVSQDQNGATEWSLDIASYCTPDLPLKFERDQRGNAA